MLSIEEIKKKYKEEENLIIINDLIECKIISNIKNLAKNIKNYVKSIQAYILNKIHSFFNLI